jgi:predicted nuclease of predicted toxin-antitoxin system
VVQVRSDDLRPESIGSMVVQALRQTAEELEAGALLAIDMRRTRVRLLPLR